MLPVIRDVQSADGNQENTKLATVTVNTVAGDYLLAWVSTEYNSYAAILAPNDGDVTQASWTQRWGGGTSLNNNLHAKLFTNTSPSSGTKTFTATMPTGTDGTLTVAVIDSSTVATGPANWVYSASTAALTAASVTHVIPSVTASGTEDNLVLGWASTNTGTTYTVPGTVTRRTSAVSRTWISSILVSKPTTGAVATGAENLTSSQNRNYISSAVAIPGATSTVVAPPTASMFPSWSDEFNSNAGRFTLSAGASIANGALNVNATFAGGTQYNSARTAAESMSGKTFVWNVKSLPAGNANAQMWVQDITPAATVDRAGFEYVGATGTLQLLTQGTAGYTQTAGTISVANWLSIGHTWFKLEHTGTQLVWSTSADGKTWVERRRMTIAGTTPSTAWLNTADVQVSFEAYRNATGATDTLSIESVNVLPSTEVPLPTSPPTLTDKLQERTVAELASWNEWLTANNAKGFVGEYATVSKWADYGDAYQQGQWNTLADKYLEYADFARISSAYWASGREFDAGYPLGLHVGATQNAALTVAQAPSATIAKHPSRPSANVIRAVNLAGHENGVTINGPGTVRSGAPFIHTSADFAFLKSNGVDTVRLPIAWERIQTTLGATLDTTAMAAIAGMVASAAANGIRVILDLHNYGRYTLASGTVVSLGNGITQAQFNNVWTQLSTWTRADATRNTTVIGYGLMNEPHGLTIGAAGWQTWSQNALTAIRGGGDNKLVLVSGYNFASLFEWRASHPTGWITDSANNFMYEAHHYWDSQTYNADGTPSPRSGQFQQLNAAGTGHETMTYARELASTEAPPERYTGSGSTTSRSNTSGYGSGRHIATGLASQSRSETSGSGVGTHGGAGAVDSGSGGSGTGKIAQVGKTESWSSGDGRGSGAHQGSSVTPDYSRGDGKHTARHVGTGVPVASGSAGDAKHTAKHFGRGVPARSGSTTGGDGRAQVLSSAGIVRPNVGMTVRLIDEDGNPGAYLPDWTSIGYTERVNDIGTVAIEYARNGHNAHLLTADRTEGALFDGAKEIAGTRFLVTQSKTDGVKESTSTIALNSPQLVPTRLAEATVYPDLWPRNTVANKLSFVAKTPGEIIGTLIGRAKSRGAIAEVEPLFSNTADCRGRRWQNVVTMEVEPGGSIMSVIDKLVEMGVLDWDAHSRELRLYEPALHGQDRIDIGYPVVLQAGRDILDAPESRDAGEIMSVCLVKGKEGRTVEVVDSESYQLHGRVEGYVSVDDVEDDGTLRAIGQAILRKNKIVLESFTHELTLFSTDGPQPWVDYYPADWVGRDMGDGKGVQKYRVAQLSATYNQAGMVSGAITLGTRFETTAQKLQAKIDALTNGSGSSASAPSTAIADDTNAPAKPLGLTLSSDAYTMPTGGGTFSAVRALWGPVTRNDNGSQITDLDHYEVQWRNASRYDGPSFDYDLAEAACEAYYARDFGHELFEDFTYVGMRPLLRKMHDRLADLFYGNGGQFNEREVDAFLMNTLRGNLPARPSDGWEMAGRPQGNVYSFSQIPTNSYIQVRVRAVDRSGNLSDWSDLAEIRTASDDIPPPVPSTPTAENYLGVLRGNWDGKGVGGVAMPEDFVVAEVHISTASASFTPTAATLVDNLAGAGITVIADLPYGVTHFIRLVAVDSSGNRSAPSAAASATPAQLVNIDIGPNAIARAQIIDGEIVNAKIADLAVNNAKISSLSVGKLTAGIMSADVTVSGRFATALTGQRVEINAQGIQKYDAQGNLVVDITNTNTFIRGRITTGMQGGSRITMGADNAGTGTRHNLTAVDPRNNAIVGIGQIYNEDTGAPLSNGILVQVDNNSGNDVFYSVGSVEPNGGANRGTTIYHPATGTARFRVTDNDHDFISLRNQNNQTVFSVTQNLVYADSAPARGNTARGGWQVTDSGSFFGIRDAGKFYEGFYANYGNDVSIKGSYTQGGVFYGINIYTTAGGPGTISAANFQTVSSRTVKSDIEDYVPECTSVREQIDGLNPVTFTYTADDRGVTRLGFIAEDALEVTPLVSNGGGIDGLALSALIRARQIEQDNELDELWAAVQELRSGN